MESNIIETRQRSRRETSFKNKARVRQTNRQTNKQTERRADRNKKGRKSDR